MKILFNRNFLGIALLCIGLFLVKTSFAQVHIRHADSLRQIIDKRKTDFSKKEAIVSFLRYSSSQAPDLAKDYAEKALKNKFFQTDSLLIAKLYKYYGISLIEKKAYNESINVHRQGIAYVQKINNPEALPILRDLYANEAALYGGMGFRYTQLQKMAKILPLNRKLKDGMATYNMYYNFALAYYALNEFNKALENLYQARSFISDESVKYHERGYSEILMAGVYLRLHKPDSVIKYVNLANKTVNSSLTPVYQARLMTLRGLSLLFQNKPEKALEFINIGTALADSIQDPGEQQYAVLAKVDYYSYRKDWLKAIAMLDDLLYKQPNKLGDNYKKDAFLKLTVAYEAAGNFTNAIATYKNLLTHIEAVEQSKLRNHLQELDFNFKFQDKLIEIERLKTNTEKVMISTQRNHLLIAVLAAILIVVLVVIFFVFKTQKRKKTHNKQLLRLMEGKMEEERQRHVIGEMTLLKKVEDKERNRIANDLHDSIGGILSAIKIAINHHLEQNKVDDVTLKTAGQILGYIDESKQELNRIVYNLTPLLIEQFGIIEAIKQYCHKIESENFKINLQLISFPSNLGVDNEITLYRVMQEAIHNVHKHAQATEVLLQIQTDKDGVIAISIEDNGIGMDINDIQLQVGLGIRSLFSRVQHLNGHIRFQSEPQVGTSIYILCRPLKQKEAPFPNL